MSARAGGAVRRILAVSSLVGSAILLSSADKPVFTKKDKAFFAPAEVVAFVRPGLVAKIKAASIAQDGTVQVQFTLTDPKGLGLDRTGVDTPGAISTSFVVGVLPRGQNQYTSYITRTQTSSSGVSAQQAAADSGGAYQQTGDGQYTYTYKNKAPSGFDTAATHTVGMWASRDLSEFDLGTNSDDDVFSFVPNGAAVTQVHDEVRTVTCNKCHDPLQAHGGARRSVPLCVICHQPQTVDPDTGNTVDMKVFIHKIHMGESLPSVKAGHPYQIIGFQNAVNDFSNVVFPAVDTRNCTFCHEGGIVPPPNSGQADQGGVTPPTGGSACGSAENPGCNPDLAPWPAANVNYWTNHPTRAACGACHDNVNFVTGENHADLPEISDKQCAECHILQGELPFDVSIVGAHTIPQYAPGVPGVVFKLIKVDNGAAGKSPTVTYMLNDKSGHAIQPSDMNFLNLVMAGPTADYQSVVSESALKTSTGQSGTYSYTFKATVPAGATGTFSIGIEGYKNFTLLPGTKAAQTVRDVGFNDVINFSVDGSDVSAHPVEIAQANCNQCHFALALHGGIRQNVQYCLLCHNPTQTDSSQRPVAQNPPQTIDFPVMIHRIHFGDQTEGSEGALQLTPFIIYGFNGSVNDFSDVRFPGDLRDCAKCHVNDGQQVPVPDTRIAVNSPRAFINPTPPMTAACTGCHVEKAASAHADAMTSPKLGESCAVCHSPDGDFSVDKVHARSL